MRCLSLKEAIEYATLGVELEQAYRELVKQKFPRRGEPAYERWRALGLRFNAVAASPETEAPIEKGVPDFDDNPPDGRSDSRGR